MLTLRDGLAAVQTGPLIVAIVAGLVLFTVVMVVSVKARAKLRSEIQSEQQTRPPGELGPAERRAKQWLVLGVVLAPVFLVLGLVAAFSTRNHGSVPAWDSWILAILFWGTVIGLGTRQVIRGRRRRSDPQS